ncbi:hypothetical protein Mapa_004271 [Marchantia paleacea]|nr:hypothetical protein Mapa_004271 [Marchantia paleacea]
MGIKIYGSIMSPYVKLVVLALYEQNVEDFEFLVTNPHDPDFIANTNPFGKIPALEVDGFIVFESRAIAKYIANKYASQGQNLVGSTVEEKARVDMWIDVEALILQPIIIMINGQTFYLPKVYNVATNEALLEENCAQADKLLEVYDAHLAKNKYLAGDFYSIADMVHLPLLYIFMNKTGKEGMVTSRKHVNAWWEDISSRPAWKKVLEKHMEDIER